MAIEIVCDDCGNKYRVSDDKAGSKVRCRECGSRIDVPDGDDDFDTEAETRRRPSKKRKKASSGPPTGVIIGVGAVVGVVIIGVVLFSMLGGGGQQVAQNGPAPLPNSGPAPVGVPPGQSNPPPGPVTTLPNSQPAQPAATLPNTNVAANPAAALPRSQPAATLPQVNDAATTPMPNGAVAQAPGGKKFGGFANGDAGAANADAGAGGPPDAPLPDNWKVKVDPTTVETRVDSSKPITLKFPKGATNEDILYPASPSVFVALGANSGFSPTREIWNLATKAKVGTINGDFARGWPVLALSPDGQHMAMTLSGGKKGVAVWICKTGKALGELETESDVKNVLFAGTGRLVGLCGDGSAKVWKLPSGDLEHELAVDKGNEPNSAIPSPGGNYLAVVTDKTALKMFDLSTGEVAGELSLPHGKEFFAGKPDAMAFSPDGKELAMVTPSGISQMAFVNYNVEDGKLLASVELNMKNLGHGPSRVMGNRLQWFPDRSMLLWRGHYILDAKIGGPVWSAPEEDGSSDAPRLLLDEKKILITVGGRQNPSLRTAPIPLSEISASAKIVAEGGEAHDAGMPQLMKADTEGVTPIAAGAVASWSMKPDPTAAGKPVKGSIALPRDRPSIGGVYIASPSTGKAVVWYTDDFGTIAQAKGLVKHQGAVPPGGKGTALIDVIDLAAGKAGATLPIPYPSAVLDVSPDGDSVAVKTTKPNDERIDVYSIADGKLAPVAGWRPFQQKEDFFKGITLAVLLDSQHCLTQNFKGSTYLWKLPECKAIWRLEAGKNFCLSPGGQYLGFQADTRYLFMEARTGELVAELPVIMPNIYCAFHPTGTHLAMLSSDGVSRKITVVDVATGKATADFFAPQGNDAIQWCGDTSLLLDGKWLVDLKQQKNGWQYNLTHGARARTQPDGRHWFVVSSGPLDQNVFLSGAQIPEKTVADKIDAAQLPDESLLKPGMQVNLQVNLAATSPKHPNLATEVGNNFKAGMEKNGFQVAAGGPFTFAITTAQSNTGKNMTLSSFGRLGGETTVPVIQVDCEVALLSSGQAVWKHKATMTNGTFGIVHVREGEDIGTHLSNQLWDQVANHLKNFPVPAQVFGQSAGAGLGKSELIPGGTQPGR